MKWSVPCTSMGLQAVALPYGNSSSAIKSALKKSLRAAEQDRPDVAQARRSWKRRQGMLPTTAWLRTAGALENSYVRGRLTPEWNDGAVCGRWLDERKDVPRICRPVFGSYAQTP